MDAGALAPGQQALGGIHRELAPVGRGQAGSEEGGPQHQVLEEGVGPEEPGVEEAAQGHLQEAQDDHHREQEDEEALLERGEAPLGRPEEVHYFLVACVPAFCARKASRDFSTRSRSSAG